MYSDMYSDRDSMLFYSSFCHGKYQGRRREVDAR